MRKIMVMVMAAVLLAGVMTASPVVANEDVFTETFEEDWTAVWTVAEGNAANVSQVDGGASGKALQLTGSAETDVIKVKTTRTVDYAGWALYEVTAKYKLTSYESGSGFRMYFEDVTVGESGASNYTTGVADTYKKLSFEVHYNYDEARQGYVVIEFSGKGTVLVDDVKLMHLENSLLPNGDFEADTYSSRTAFVSGVTAGFERESDGNGVAYIEGKTWSEGITIKCGAKISPGKTYIISFRYKNSAGAHPCLYLYFGTEAAPTSKYQEMRTAYQPNFADDTDGKIKVTPTGDWKTYYATFTVPADNTIANGDGYHNYRKLNYFGIRGSNSDTRSYFDDIRFMEATPEMEYTTTGDSPVESIAAAGETLRTRCFFVKDTAKDSETVMLVQAIYAEDGDGTRQLMEVKINSQTVTAKNQYITVDNTVPDAGGKTLVAESYLWSGTSGLVPIADEITID